MLGFLAAFSIFSFGNMSIIERYQYPLAIAGVGFIVFFCFKLILHISKGIRSFFIAPILGLGLNVEKLGRWAVVTGATDGIGKSYAKALAKKGMNIVLISRTQSKLEATAKELTELAGIETKCIAVDFSGGMEIYAKIDMELEGLDVGVLINNVGMSYEHPEFLLQVADRDHVFNKLLHINIFSVTFMTTMLLPRMVEKRKGAVINIGSASCFGFPLLTVYAATKAYVDSFSRNLAYEYKDKGIVIQSVFPHHVATKMAKIRKSTFMSPTPDTFANSALATLGLESATTGYIGHWLASSFFHDFLSTNLVMGISGHLAKGVRVRALKKKAAKKD